VSALQAAFQQLLEELGPEHPQVLQAQFDWAAELGHAEEYEQAGPLFRDVLALRRRLLGPRHVDTLEAERYLASVCEETGQSAEAEWLYRSALSGLQLLFGDDHVDTATSMVELAFFLWSRGQFTESVELFETGFRVREALLGSTHEDTLSVLYDLAEVYFRSRHYDRWAPTVQALYERTREAHGEDAGETKEILELITKQRALEVLRTQEWKEEGLWS
jgi:tetratricopeptide (TPR) repeat protein